MGIVPIFILFIWSLFWKFYYTIEMVLITVSTTYYENLFYGDNEVRPPLLSKLHIFKVLSKWLCKVWPFYFKSVSFVKKSYLISIPRSPRMPIVQYKYKLQIEPNHNLEFKHRIELFLLYKCVRSLVCGDGMARFTKRERLFWHSS